MAKRCGISLLKHEKGQSLVEFALILPLVALLVAGLFDLGRAFFAVITISNAAREGARYGTLHPDDTQGICDASWRELQSSGIILDNITVSISCSTTQTCSATGTPSVSCPRDQAITMNVSYDYEDMIFKFFFPTGINLQREAEMLVP